MLTFTLIKDLSKESLVTVFLLKMKIFNEWLFKFFYSAHSSTFCIRGDRDFTLTSFLPNYNQITNKLHTFITIESIQRKMCVLVLSTRMDQALQAVICKSECYVTDDIVFLKQLS